MNFGADILHIGGFINNNITIIIIAAVLAVISAIGCAVITATRRGFMDDIILSAVFGLIFNVLGLLFVFFRKPVWNNLGWIPVVGILVGIVGGLIELYVTIGIVLSVLDYLKVLK